MPPFEVFTRNTRTNAGQPQVTIQRRGNLSLNRAAYTALGEPQAVELLYDARNRTVGLRAVEVSVEHAYPVRSQGGKTTGPYLVAGIGFAKHHGIDTATARRYPAVMDGGVLCVDLSGPGTAVSSNRRTEGRTP